MPGLKQNTCTFSFCAFILCSSTLPASGQAEHVPPTGPLLTPDAAYRQHSHLPGHIPANIRSLPNSTSKVWGAPQTKDKRFENIQTLKESPELPQLPGYSGKQSKFFHGFVQPTDQGWTNYQLTYLCKESPSDVKDWYQNAFNSYQWKTVRAGGQTLSANHKDGHICTVITHKTNEQGYKTQLAIYFNQAPSKMARHN